MSSDLQSLVSNKWVWIVGIGGGVLLYYYGDRLYTYAFDATLGKILSPFTGGETYTDPTTGQVGERPYLATASDFVRHPIDSLVGLFTLQIPRAVFNNDTYDARKKILGCDTKSTWSFKFWETSLACKGRARLGLL